MTRTTPPRPVDVESEYPELRELARPATRLHPRHGNPHAGESSIGGPLLWSVAEPWPLCPHDEHTGVFGDRIVGPSPLVPALQLYTRDVPSLPHCVGSDLLQVLWCPLSAQHAFTEPVLRWRDSKSVGTPLDGRAAPHPRARKGLIPRPCTIDPEIVTDYPYQDAPWELHERFREYDEPFIEEIVEGWSMWDMLIVLGCKVGGYPSWTQPPSWPRCPGCGQRMQHLLTLIGDEGGRNWIPLEEWATAGYAGGIAEAEATYTPAAEANRHPLGMTFQDNGGFYVFFCGSCPGMPLTSRHDCH